MKLKDISKIIEDFAPISLAENYDNCGFIYGNQNDEYISALVSLDLTPSVAAEAVEKRCNIIIEHHPSIFSPLKNIDLDNPAILAMKMCIDNNIAIYAAHTNIDNVKNGLNYAFMKKIEVNPCESLYGFNGFGTLSKSTTLKLFVDRLNQILCDDTLFFVGNPQRIISKVFCVNGAGGDEENLKKSIMVGADVFISSEFKHHVLRFAKDSDYAIISTSHFSSESSFSSLIFEVLSEENIPNVLISRTCLNPITKE